MEIVEKKLLNLFFKISITVGLAGLFMYLLQEMIAAAQSFAYTAFIFLADLIGMFAIIAAIIWLFIPKHKLIFQNIVFLLGIGYVLLFVFANFLIGNYSIPGWFLLSYFEKLSTVGISFVGMILIMIFSLGLVVVLSMNFRKRDQFGIFEKFPIIIWVILIGIFDITANYYLRNVETFDIPTTATIQLGVTFLPVTLELVLILFLAIILILNFFVGINEKILSLLNLLLVNIFFLSVAVSTVSSIGFTVSDSVYAVSIIGHVFAMIAAVSLVVCTFFILKEKYPKSLATRSKG
ncbi:MAG: hypothetical protein FK733_13885 [Asgard group archaeon]|nr:hypothetical protein [Asgard group archaeon]